MPPPPEHPMTRAQLRILYIAYPLLTVSEASAGGAEQMLWTLEREMAARGALTTVAASAGSKATGELFSTGDPCSAADDFERRNHEHQERIITLVRQRAQEGRRFDLIHDESGSFWTRAAEVDVPVLATLHLPRSFYPPEVFQKLPENVSFNCVSESQARSFSDVEQMLGVVRNGISLDRFRPNDERRNGLLWLGRICDEKAPHLALEIAERGARPITVAGQVYPFSYHQQYFAREITPRLQRMPGADLILSPSAELKRQLLRQAGALLITSQVDETSSLVAMEAAASGTPVIAFARGAIPEVVKNEATGFVVQTVEEAICALSRLPQIESGVCAQVAADHFSAGTMAGRYAVLYTEVMQKRALVSAGQRSESR